MRCAWKELLAILPVWMRQQVDEQGRECLQELRMRQGLSPELVCKGNTKWLRRPVTQEDISYVVSTASKYSPWSCATMRKGYITAVGGHRIGLCGEAVIQEGSMTGLRYADSLCIRVARDIPGIAYKLSEIKGSLLIIGKPGAGKTTLLRDLIRLRGERESVAVVDERGELFPPEGGFERGRRTDVLRGCSKVQGVEMLLRVMGPAAIAVDEITSADDCEALISAQGCGVFLLATAHAESVRDLHRRPIYGPLIRSRIFDSVAVLREDKSWRLERIGQ